MERYFEISNALIKSGGVIWDEHNGGSEGKLLGMAALFTGGEIIPVGLHNGDYFSLNRVYLKDDKVHLSQESVGGTLFPVNFRDLWDCISDYNDKQVGNKNSCGTLENPMSLLPVPITVITMTIEQYNEKVGKAAPVYPPVDDLIAVPRGDMTMLSKSDAGPWLLEKLATDGTRSEGAFLPPPRTAAEVEEMGQLVASGLSPEEANKQFVSRRSGERVATLNELFEKGTKVIGTPTPEEANREAAMHRKVFGPVDFLPGDEDEIQEAYYREMLAKKETGVAPTEDLGKDIPFVAGYAGHKDPSKL